MSNDHQIYGLLAEFKSAQALIEASRKTRQEGYVRTEAFAPFPVHGLPEALGLKKTRVPMITFIGGALGAAGGFMMQWYATTVAYPINIGGRPMDSWPQYIPITFELMVLGAGLSALVGMMALNGLPEPHHPLFSVPIFSSASRDKFFLCIEQADPKFSLEETRRFLTELNAVEIWEVPPA